MSQNEDLLELKEHAINRAIALLMEFSPLGNERKIYMHRLAKLQRISYWAGRFEERILWKEDK